MYDNKQQLCTFFCLREQINYDRFSENVSGQTDDAGAYRTAGAVRLAARHAWTRRPLRRRPSWPQWRSIPARYHRREGAGPCSTAIRSSFYTDPTLAGKMTGYSWFQHCGAQRRQCRHHAAYYRDFRPASAPSMTTTPCVEVAPPMDSHGFFSLALNGSWHIDAILQPGAQDQDKTFLPRGQRPPARGAVRLT